MDNQEELVITFKEPITIGQGDKAVEYTEITLVEPTAGQLEKAMKAGGGMSVGIDLITLVAKVPRKVVESMKASQIKEASDFLASFSGSDPETPELS